MDERIPSPAGALPHVCGSTAPAAQPRPYTIARLGHDGDGIIEGANADEHGGGPGKLVFVPYTLPGERVLAEVSGDRGRLVEVIAPSADRIAAVCKHFGACGGCAMQHAAHATYASWKRDLVVRALVHQGITTAVDAIVSAPLHSRRRAVMGVKRGPSGIVLGFHEPRSHRILDIAECPILAAAIVDRLEVLRALADIVLPARGSATASGKAAGEGLRIIATAADNGLDVVLEGAGRGLGASQRSAIGVVALSGRLARVSLDRDPIYVAAEPSIRFGTVEVNPPPGVFLQAVPEIEHAMAARIVEAIGSKRGRVKRAIDLFAGLGTFTFPMATIVEVNAIDSDKPALSALDRAFRRASGLKPVTTRLRDLHREPLSAKELDEFQAVVFDPPRAGAAEQAKRIAASSVGTVIAVSCSPATLARDLAILTSGGFVIESITPYDQFVFSPHVETVVVLRRARRVIRRDRS